MRFNGHEQISGGGDKDGPSRKERIGRGCGGRPGIEVQPRHMTEAHDRTANGGAVVGDLLGAYAAPLRNSTAGIVISRIAMS